MRRARERAPKEPTPAERWIIEELDFIYSARAAGWSDRDIIERLSRVRLLDYAELNQARLEISEVIA